MLNEETGAMSDDGLTGNSSQALTGPIRLSTTFLPFSILVNGPAAPISTTTASGSSRGIPCNLQYSDWKSGTSVDAAKDPHVRSAYGDVGSSDAWYRIAPSRWKISVLCVGR